jgi:hypothetical protein
MQFDHVPGVSNTGPISFKVMRLKFQFQLNQNMNGSQDYCPESLDQSYRIINPAHLIWSSFMRG